jgi:hypothetical protein
MATGKMLWPQKEHGPFSFNPAQSEFCHWTFLCSANDFINSQWIWICSSFRWESKRALPSDHLLQHIFVLHCHGFSLPFSWHLPSGTLGLESKQFGFPDPTISYVDLHPGNASAPSEFSNWLFFSIRAPNLQTYILALRLLPLQDVHAKAQKRHPKDCFRLKWPEPGMEIWGYNWLKTIRFLSLVPFDINSADPGHPWLLLHLQDYRRKSKHLLLSVKQTKASPIHAKPGYNMPLLHPPGLMGLFRLINKRPSQNRLNHLSGVSHRQNWQLCARCASPIVRVWDDEVINFK